MGAGARGGSRGPGVGPGAQGGCRGLGWVQGPGADPGAWGGSRVPGQIQGPGARGSKLRENTGFLPKLVSEDFDCFKCICKAELRLYACAQHCEERIFRDPGTEVPHHVVCFQPSLHSHEKG